MDTVDDGAGGEDVNIDVRDIQLLTREGSNGWQCWVGHLGFNWPLESDTLSTPPMNQSSLSISSRSTVTASGGHERCLTITSVIDAAIAFLDSVVAPDQNWARITGMFVTPCMDRTDRVNSVEGTVAKFMPGTILEEGMSLNIPRKELDAIEGVLCRVR
jgi:hypothetical protein